MDKAERNKNYSTKRPTPRDDWYLYDGLGTFIGVVAIKADAERIVDALNNAPRYQVIERAARLYVKDASDDSTDANTLLGSFNALAAALEPK
jgi:hypothetical protein